jgi:hypothetical protein
VAAGDITEGQARPDAKPWELQPGEYCVRVDSDSGKRVAWVVTPNGHGPSRLDGWDLIEHDDGTITVSPSILAHPAADNPGWHGYLEQGVWREV